MNVLIINRAEICCLMILVFLLFYSSVYCQHEGLNRFKRICLCAIGHVLFDTITVYTVNHMEQVSEMLNRICHCIFYLYALFFGYELFLYIVEIIYPMKIARKYSRMISVIPISYLCMIPFLRIDYLVGKGTYYSGGPCVYVGYSMATLLFVLCAVVIFKNRNKLEHSVRRALFPMIAFLLVGITVQIFIPEILLTGIAVSLATLGVFLTIENPVGKLREHAYVDLKTGIKNKNAYEKDIKWLSQIYQGDEEQQIGCLVCDLNGLKIVNDQHGHMVGDELISMAAEVLSQQLKLAYGIYRVGGDEFIALYINKRACDIVSEMEQVRAACDRVSQNKMYTLSIAMGYAQASVKKDILEIADLADKRMYQDKVRIRAIASGEE